MARPYVIYTPHGMPSTHRKWIGYSSYAKLKRDLAEHILNSSTNYVEVLRSLRDDSEVREFWKLDGNSKPYKI